MIDSLGFSRTRAARLVKRARAIGLIGIMSFLVSAPGWAQELSPNDPYYYSVGSWGQSYDDQWAVKQVGFGGPKTAWDMLGPDPQPVVVAVVDTGLDWNHFDLSNDNIWRNGGEIADNGIDDDDNGFVDDLIGWDFFTQTNKPWDNDGHGTFVSGLIAAKKDNHVGIAGINPHAKIMVVKAVNNFGHSRASFVARGIVYAVDNGAKIINLSVGGPDATLVEKAALDYAAKKGVLVVAAAGNEGKNIAKYGLVTHPAVLTVAASDPDGNRAPFSNWGRAIAVAAPGVDILSLRARRTDTMLDLVPNYQPGTAYVGADKRYYRTSGTSFSAPIVTGIASLLLTKNPALTAVDLKRILTNSARDIDAPGVDQLTGYGRIDALAALAQDPAFSMEAEITGLTMGSGSDTNRVIVTGTANADQMTSAQVEIGKGDNPSTWKKIGDRINKPVTNGRLTTISAGDLQGASVWTVRVVVTHKNRRTLENRFRLTME